MIKTEEFRATALSILSTRGETLSWDLRDNMQQHMKLGPVSNLIFKGIFSFNMIKMKKEGLVKRRKAHYYPPHFPVQAYVDAVYYSIGDRGAGTPRRDKLDNIISHMRGQKPLILSPT